MTNVTITRYALMRRAVAAWPAHELADRHQRRALQARWLAAVRLLGERWLAHPARRLQRRADLVVFAVAALSALPWESL